MDSGQLKLLTHASNQQWDIPRRLRKKAPKILGKIIESEAETSRNRISAIRALIAANGQNIAQAEQDGGGKKLQLTAKQEDVVLYVKQQIAEMSDEELILAIARGRVEQHSQSRVVPSDNGQKKP